MLRYIKPSPQLFSVGCEITLTCVPGSPVARIVGCSIRKPLGDKLYAVLDLEAGETYHLPERWLAQLVARKENP